MRQRIVAGEDDVELSIDLRGEVAHVSDAERERSVASGGLALRTSYRVGAEIGSVDPVAEERKTDGLGADTAGAVQNGVGSWSELLLNQPIDHRSLAPHRSLPIGKDEMVALGQFVVERPH